MDWNAQSDTVVHMDGKIKLTGAFAPWLHTCLQYSKYGHQFGAQQCVVEPGLY